MAQTRKYYLKNNYVKGQGPTKVIMVRDTPPYGHAPTYKISLTYLERQKKTKKLWSGQASKGRHKNILKKDGIL